MSSFLVDFTTEMVLVSKGFTPGEDVNIAVQGERLKNHLQQLQANLTVVSAGQGLCPRASRTSAAPSHPSAKTSAVWLHTHSLDMSSVCQ